MLQKKGCSVLFKNNCNAQTSITITKYTVTTMGINEELAQYYKRSITGYPLTYETSFYINTFFILYNIIFLPSCLYLLSNRKSNTLKWCVFHSNNVPFRTKLLKIKSTVQ